MSTAIFKYLQLSDLHLCLEPRRNNALSLLSREVVSKIDAAASLVKQIPTLGLSSLIKPASYEPGQLSGVARFCNARQGELDGIIITGDLCTTGMLEDISTGERFLNGRIVDGILTQEGTPAISELKDVIVAFPGNHDRYKDNSGTPNSNLFELKFGSFMPNYSDRVGHWIDTKRGQYLAFVYADFSWRTKSDAALGMLKGGGKVYPEILKGVMDRTALLRQKYPKCKIVWALHFAPYDCQDNFLELTEHYRLIGHAFEAEVALLLNGHTHASLFELFDGKPISCAGSATATDVSPKNAIHILEFKISSKDCTVSRTDFDWNDSEQEFEQSPNSKIIYDC